MHKILAAFLMMAAATAAAYGQTAEASISVGASIFTNKDLGDLGVVNAVQQTLKLDNGFRISARLSLNQLRFFGHEIGYGYDRSHLVGLESGPATMAVHQGFYDFLVHALPEGSPVRPFVCAGGGFSSFYPPGASVYAGNGITKFGYNYGGGIKVKLSPVFGLRFDVRDYVSGKPDFGLPNVKGLLHNVEASAGFAILF
ncbi:MAG: outer membrane beta-barrel protein [Acidobacteria bacterium]|nr:outer membrane beta-barrel protein [Acidobacteriota bacterium]